MYCYVGLGFKLSQKLLRIRWRISNLKEQNPWDSFVDTRMIITQFVDSLVVESWVQLLDMGKF